MISTHTPVSTMVQPSSPTLPYLNRELSWLDFNARVLEEALDPRVPLLERLKFLAIFSTNLDEFYMVRVAGLRRKVSAGSALQSPDLLTTDEQLDAIRTRVAGLLERRRYALQELLWPELEVHGIRLVRMEDLLEEDARAIRDFFESQVFPILTPLAVDPGHPFPYISNLSLSLAVEIRDPETNTVHFARVKVPRSLPRWVPVGRLRSYVPLEEVIGAYLGTLFPGYAVERWYTFRITRYSDLDLGQIDQPDDLLETIEQQVFQRRFGEVVRLEVQREMPTSMRSLLLEELGESDAQSVAPLTEEDIHDVDELLEYGDLMDLCKLNIPGLQDAPHTPVIPSAFRDGRNIFDVIRERDVLVHHPYESFDASVETFLETAAYDPHVLAIKLTLYRTSGDTAMVKALTEAAEQGKQVAVLIELQARFDEQNNITFARTLENFGIHVAYGLPGLKTHAKTALVVRRDEDGIRRYVHIGTGNYNSTTARLYTDLGLFTCDPQIGADLTELFNSLTGMSRQRRYRKLLVAPANLRESTIAMIEREAEHARAGRGGRIIGKMNALVDPAVIAALYQAAQAGVQIDLNVRGICCLLPGVPGISEGIRVISIIGRFLEHSRVWYYANAGDPQYYIGSADWMPRNLDRRVEVLTPVEDPQLHKRLYSMLETYLADNRQAWELGMDGKYERRYPGDEAERASQATFMVEPWGMIADGVPVPAKRRRSNHGRSHARTEGRGRTNPTNDD